MVKAPKNTRGFEALVEVVAALRGPEGCPWDKAQTHTTLTQYAIEEAHELADAIDQGDQAGVIEELGDLLLQVILHAEIAQQEKRFTLADVIQGITEKMIRRHPHVFADTKVADSNEVLANWARLKDAEKPASHAANPFASIPRQLPALLRAQKIGHKTVRYNFDWPHVQDVVNKVDEEIGELKQALAAHDSRGQQEELGDVLFTLAQLARHLEFDAEQALRLTNAKFETRFIRMRELVAQDHKNYADLSGSELEAYWQKAKLDLKANRIL